MDEEFYRQFRQIREQTDKLLSLSLSSSDSVEFAKLSPAHHRYIFGPHIPPVLPPREPPPKEKPPPRRSYKLTPPPKPPPRKVPRRDRFKKSPYHVEGDGLVGEILELAVPRDWSDGESMNLRDQYLSLETRTGTNILGINCADYDYQGRVDTIESDIFERDMMRES